MDVLGGSFPKGIGSVDKDFFGNFLQLRLPKGMLSWQAFQVAEIKSAIPIGDKKEKSLFGLLDGVLTGAILAGPLGAVVGGAVSGSKTKLIIQIVLGDGRVAVAAASVEEYASFVGAIANHQTEASRGPSVAQENEAAAVEFLSSISEQPPYREEIRGIDPDALTDFFQKQNR